MAQSHPVRAHALALLAPCPLRLTSALSPRRSDDLPVALFDEPALVRVPRTAHVIPTAPLANNPCPCPLRHPRGLVSPGSAPALLVSRLPLPPTGRCVSAILKPRRPPSPTPSGPTPLCPTPPPTATRPLQSSPSRGTRPARGPRPPVRGHHRPHAFSRGLLSDTCTLHAAWSMPTASFYACVASAACCGRGAMRVPCVVRVVCTARRNRAGQWYKRP